MAPWRGHSNPKLNATVLVARHLLYVMRSFNDLPSLWPLRGALNTESPKKLKRKRVESNLDVMEVVSFWILLTCYISLLKYISNNSRIAACRLGPETPLKLNAAFLTFFHF